MDESSSFQNVNNEITNLQKPISVALLKDLYTVTSTINHYIHLKQDAKPLKQKQRRIAVNYQRDFDQIMEDMIISKKTSPTHTSPWASQSRLLRKKDGSIRVTIDYKYLNSCTQKILYPFPFAEDIFARLTNATYFT